MSQVGQRTPVRFVWHFPWHPKNLQKENVVVVLKISTWFSKIDSLRALFLLKILVSHGFSKMQIAVVGKSISINDKAFEAICKKAIFWGTENFPKNFSREDVEQLMRRYYDCEYNFNIAIKNQPKENPHPYTYNPSPPKMTAEELKEYIGAIAKRK